MISIFCSACREIFEGDKGKTLSLLRQSPHLGSLQQFHRAIDVGCYICSTLKQELLVKGVQPLSLKSFRSDFVFDNTEIPVKLWITMTVEDEDGTRKRGVPFGVSPLRPGVDLREMSTPLAPSLGSDETMERMKAWYRDCRDHHSQCSWRLKGADEFYLPTRLLNVGYPESKTCRLLITAAEKLDSISEGYLTLSHRWGQAEFMQLNSSTIGALTAGISISDLPRCFQDAILLAHELGIRYLWIDSLCIRQDMKEDWLKEAPNMQNVYGCAAVNIVAAHSSGPYDSIFRTRDPPLAQSAIVTSGWDGEDPTDYLLWDYWRLREDFDWAPLTNRGWVFQERMLAPRMLQFGKDQVYWRCPALFACESWPQGAYTKEGEPVKYGVDMDQFKLKADTVDPVALWKTLVVRYSRCELTFSDDKLIALSGVAQLFRQITGDRYLAGLWWSRIATFLRWKRNDQDPARPRPLYRAPTWSWASIDGPVAFAHYDYLLEYAFWRKTLVEVLDADVTPLHGDDMAQVKDGYITVKGKLHPFVLISQEEEKTVYEVDGQVRTGKAATFIADIMLEDPDKLQLWLLPITVNGVVDFDEECFILEGLVMVRSTELGMQGSDDESYMRVGYFQSRNYYMAMRDKAFGLHIDMFDPRDEDAADEEAFGEVEGEWDDYEVESDVFDGNSIRFRRCTGPWHVIKIV